MAKHQGREPVRHSAGWWPAEPLAERIALIGTILVPRLWVDPMGPMLKIFPILALHLAALAIVEHR